MEVEVEGRRLSLSNLDKVFYPATGFTKGQVIEYYTRIAPVLLPHLRGRHLTLKRYPDGVDGQFFYEKQCPRSPARLGPHRRRLVAPQRARDRLLPRRRPRDGRLAGEPRRPRDAHAAGVRDGPAGADDAGVRPRPGAAGDDRRVRGGRLPAARGVRPLRAASRSRRRRGRRACSSTCRSTRRPTYRGHEAVRARASRRCSSGATPSSSCPRCAGTGARARCSSTGARTTSTRRRCASTRCARASARRSRRRSTWDEVEAVLRSRDPDELAFTSDEVLARVDEHGDGFAPVLELEQELPGVRRLLLTGAAGRIATAVRPVLRELAGDVVLTDRTEPAGLAGGERFAAADLADPGPWRCAGCGLRRDPAPRRDAGRGAVRAARRPEPARRVPRLRGGAAGGRASRGRRELGPRDRLLPRR